MELAGRESPAGTSAPRTTRRGLRSDPLYAAEAAWPFTSCAMPSTTYPGRLWLYAPDVPSPP